MFEQEFEYMLRNHKDIIGDKKKFTGLVKDYFPEQAKYVNLLLMAYDMGIAEEMLHIGSINNTFAFKYVKQLMDNYGISRKNADWIVSIWCVCYGEKLLGKKNEIEVQKANDGPAINEGRKDTRKLYSDNYLYTSPNNGCVGINGFSGDETTTVILPNRYQNYVVNYLKSGAFSRTNVEEVIITDGYTKVNAAAFTYCYKLHQVILPESIKEIEEFAFSECNNLKSINLPSGLERICIRAFSYTGLRTIQIPRTVYSIEDYAFEGCGEIDNIEIPSNIHRISKGMFKDCTSLKKIVFSEQLEEIEKEAFMGCSSLDFVIIPDSVREIGEDAFSGTDDMFIVQCSFGSYAEQYCRKNRIKYQLV